MKSQTTRIKGEEGYAILVPSCHYCVRGYPYYAWGPGKYLLGGSYPYKQHLKKCHNTTNIQQKRTNEKNKTKPSLKKFPERNKCWKDF